MGHYWSWGLEQGFCPCSRKLLGSSFDDAYEAKYGVVPIKSPCYNFPFSFDFSFDKAKKDDLLNFFPQECLTEAINQTFGTKGSKSKNLWVLFQVFESPPILCHKSNPG